MGKHFYNFHLKLLEFAFTGTACFLCNCNADKPRHHPPVTCSAKFYHPVCLSHPCLLPVISCFQFTKSVGRRKVLVAGHSSFSEVVGLILFQFLQESCHKVNITHLGKLQSRRYEDFYSFFFQFILKLILTSLLETTYTLISAYYSHV